MCTYNAISSHTDHFEIQKRDSEESLYKYFGGYYAIVITLRYDFCKCSVILEHRYVYTKHILNSTIIANIKVCSKQMQCVIEALMCIFKTF